MKCAAIIPAAGLGSRYGSSIPKQFKEYESIPVLIHTLRLFEKIPDIFSIVVPINPAWEEYAGEMFSVHSLMINPKIVHGGEERQDSIYNALKAIEPNDYDIILIHDAVRPFFTVELVNKIISAAAEFGAAIPVLPPRDTIKEIDNDGFVSKTFDRTKLCCVQTPQGFKPEIIVSSYEKARTDGFYGTDDAALVEYAGFPVRVIEGEESNIKITTPYDIDLGRLKV
jgi:2-C-methyl-D-erythritol 4-phosphate cytidylyltransferase